MFSLCAITLHALPVHTYQGIFDMYEHANNIKNGINLMNKMTGMTDNHDLLYDANLFIDYLLEYVDACTDFTMSKKKRRQICEKSTRTFHKNDISTRDIQTIINKSVMTLDKLVAF